MQQRGDRHIAFVPINGLSFTACDSHPSLADEKIIADELEHAIDANPHAWGKR
jgi:hypothetical protein